MALRSVLELEYHKSLHSFWKRIFWLLAYCCWLYMQWNYETCHSLALTVAIHMLVAVVCIRKCIVKRQELFSPYWCTKTRLILLTFSPQWNKNDETNFFFKSELDFTNCRWTIKRGGFSLFHPGFRKKAKRGHKEGNVCTVPLGRGQLCLSIESSLE